MAPPTSVDDTLSLNVKKDESSGPKVETWAGALMPAATLSPTVTWPKRISGAISFLFSSTKQL